jgi:phosphatidylglycerophosphate synthase
MRHDDSYSTIERRLLPLVRRGAAAMWAPLIGPLARLNVSPHLISASQLAWAAVFWVSVLPAPRLALAAFVIALLMDSLDGALARATGRSGAFGALVDQISDHTREAMIVAALASAGALNAGLGVMYAFIYPAFNFILFLSNRVGAPVPFTVKTLFLFYPTIVAYLGFGVNVLDYGVGLALASMLISGALALLRIRQELA